MYANRLKLNPYDYRVRQVSPWKATLIMFAIAVIFIAVVLGFYYGIGVDKNRTPELFSSVQMGPIIKKPNPLTEVHPSHNYNALYTSPDDGFLYTDPPGDPKAQAYGHSGEGTSGEFLPLQGLGAGVYMKNTATNNKILPSPNPGQIGGQPNYTTQKFSSRWNGFNDFGAPFDQQTGPETHNYNYTNSYLIDGANERVTNSGQKSSSTKCQSWYPALKKDNKGFCVQASDAMVECDQPNQNIWNCRGQGADRFVESKMQPRWEKVFQ
jgi:hypothetical protein